MTEKDIIKIAEILRIEIKEKETSSDVLKFLPYLKKLNEFSVVGLNNEKDTVVEELENVFRKDEKREINIDKSNEIINAFPEKNNRSLKVQPIFDKNEEL